MVATDMVKVQENRSASHASSEELTDPIESNAIVLKTLDSSASSARRLGLPITFKVCTCY